MGDIRVGLFVIRDGTEHPAEVATIRRSVEACTFPWMARCIPYLRARHQRDHVPVVVEDRDGRGSYWPNAVIVMDPAATTATFLHEMGHAVDATITRDYDAHQEMHAVLHGGQLPDGCTSWNDRTHSRSAREAFAYWFSRRHGGGLGYSRTVYGPHDISPAVDDQLDAIIARYAEGIRVYSDVPPDGTHAAAIEKATARGVMTGNPDGTFEPMEPVTRGQLASILAGLGLLDPRT